jgi:acyl dehydratase
MRLTRRGDRGIVKLEMQIMNQNGHVVQEGSSDLMVRRRAAQEETSSN